MGDALTGFLAFAGATFPARGSIFGFGADASSRVAYQAGRRVSCALIQAFAAAGPLSHSSCGTLAKTSL